MKEEKFRAATGSDWLLRADTPERIEDYLRRERLLAPYEVFMGVEKPGEGNMNLTLRIRTDQRTFILKQARPWVEKYPEIPAPVERIHVEAAFLEVTKDSAVIQAHTPQLLAADPANYLLFLTDLGAAGDLTRIYRKGQSLSAGQLEILLAYLSALHAHPTGEFPDNLPLRRLNHEHIFVFPFRDDTGFDLDTVVPGLAQVAQLLREDEKLIAEATALGEQYLQPGPCLLHGDFYPGSWLQTDGQTWVIDAEFAHLGRPEFDVGVLLAHLDMSQADPEAYLSVDDHYVKPAEFNADLAEQLRGIELIRRLIGLAQLPLDLSLAERRDLLAKARSLILS